MKYSTIDLLVLAGMLAGLLTIGAFGSYSGQDNTDSAQTEFAGYELVQIPENGWTTEELASAIRIYDAPLAKNMNLKHFGDKFSYERNFIYQYEDGYVNVSLDRLGRTGATVYLDTHDINDITGTTPVKYLQSISSRPEEHTERLWINGCRLNDTPQAVIAALGEPSYIAENEVYEGFISTFMYDDRETGLPILTITFGHTTEPGNVAGIIFFPEGNSAWLEARKTRNENVTEKWLEILS